MRLYLLNNNGELFVARKSFGEYIGNRDLAKGFKSSISPHVLKDFNDGDLSSTQ